MITAIKDELNETIGIRVTSPDGRFRRFKKKQGENTNKFIKRVGSQVRAAVKKLKITRQC